MYIQAEVDKEQLEYVQRELGEMADKAPNVIKNAVNRAARKARKQFHEEIKKNYTVNQAGFNSRIQLVLAKPGRLYAIVKSKDRTLTTSRFKHKTSKKDGVSVDIDRTGFKQVVSKDSGKKGIISKSVQRVSDKLKGRSRSSEEHPIKAFKRNGLIMQRETSDRFPVKVLRSASIPKMVEMTYKGGGSVHQALKPIIEKTLKEEIDIGIGKELLKNK